MTLHEIGARGLVLLGCGKMGSALVAGWLEAGLDASALWVVEPAPSPWLEAQAQGGLRLNAGFPDAPAAVVVAVKPQIMADALANLSGFAGRTTVVSIAAGIPLSRFEAAFGEATPIVRAMPNTPAAIGRGITALVGNAAAGKAEMALAETLLRAVGDTLVLPDEAHMDAVTALSGSGPAYVFHLIETMAAAGEAEGLDADTALRLAVATVAGAGALAESADELPARLRENVTSPGGTTAAALAVLMDAGNGLGPLMRRAIAAAAARSRELGG